MFNLDVMLQTMQDFGRQAAAFVPRLVLALLVIALGWLLAKVARYVVERALRAINFGVLTERAGTDHFLQQAGLRGDTTTLFGLIAYCAVLIAALVVACNGMNLPYLSQLLTDVEAYVPRLVYALLVLILGSYSARFVGTSVYNHCQQAQIPDADMLGRVVRYLIMIFVLMIVISQLDLGGRVVTDVFLILLAGLVLTLALAFGIGGRDWAAQLLERWWPARPRHRD